MQNDEEFFIGDYDEASSSSDLELVIDKALTKREDQQEDAPESQNILDYDIESFTDKPWNKPGADITDYFNYGFNETTWREYCNMQKRKNEFASNNSEWNDGKYSGVRRGFSEIKKDDDRDVHRREKPRKGGREERESGKRGYGEGQRWDSWGQGRKEDRSGQGRGQRNAEKEDKGMDRKGRSYGNERDESGGKRHGYRDTRGRGELLRT